MILPKGRKTTLNPLLLLVLLVLLLLTLEQLELPKSRALVVLLAAATQVCQNFVSLLDLWY